MERAVEIFAVIHLVTMGVSHIVQPGVWVTFFVGARERDRAGVFAIGFLCLMFGSIVETWTTTTSTTRST